MSAAARASRADPNPRCKRHKPALGAETRAIGLREFCSRVAVRRPGAPPTTPVTNDEQGRA